MAMIRIDELIALVKSHPDYGHKWEMDTPAEMALYIEFVKADPGGVEETVFDAADGHHVVIDRDSAGLVRGIEIV